MVSNENNEEMSVNDILSSIKAAIGSCSNTLINFLNNRESF